MCHSFLSQKAVKSRKIYKSCNWKESMLTAFGTFCCICCHKIRSSEQRLDIHTAIIMCKEKSSKMDMRFPYNVCTQKLGLVVKGFMCVQTTLLFSHSPAVSSHLPSCWLIHWSLGHSAFCFTESILLITPPTRPVYLMKAGAHHYKINS